MFQKQCHHSRNSYGVSMAIEVNFLFATQQLNVSLLKLPFDFKFALIISFWLFGVCSLKCCYSSQSFSRDYKLLIGSKNAELSQHFFDLLSHYQSDT